MSGEHPYRDITVFTCLCHDHECQGCESKKSGGGAGNVPVQHHIWAPHPCNCGPLFVCGGCLSCVLPCLHDTGE